MQRTTIMLPPELKIAARNLANELGISVGNLIREALLQRLEQNKEPRGSRLVFCF